MGGNVFKDCRNLKKINLSVCDKLEEAIDESLKKAELLRQSILKKAFSGELTKEWRKNNPPKDKPKGKWKKSFKKK